MYKIIESDFFNLNRRLHIIKINIDIQKKYYLHKIFISFKRQSKMIKYSKIPGYHYEPKNRLQNQLLFDNKNDHFISEMKNYDFYTIPKYYYQKKELIYDPIHGNYTDDLIFSADFESGNLGTVYKISNNFYEINMLPDPTKQYSATWFLFKIDRIPPGEYTFIVNGFFRNAQLHNLGVQPTIYSTNKAMNGKGWFRVGHKLNFWCTNKDPYCQIWALRFSIKIDRCDTIYLSYLYPYTYSMLIFYLKSNPIQFSCLCRTLGGIDLPMIFWDADFRSFKSHEQIIRQQYLTLSCRKPLIIIASRLHPGESNSSFAMEGFLDQLFVRNSKLLTTCSFLILPMMNPDGVVCGYYRPQLNGIDMNRSWKTPSPKSNPEVFSVIKLCDSLSHGRKILFLLDFHGHTAQCNAFTYSVKNSRVKYNQYQGVFTEILGRYCSFFSVKDSCSMLPKDYPSTMRVALHQRYQIPFAYTLEMSFGGINMGERAFTQFRQEDYIQVGAATVLALEEMLLYTCKSCISD